MIQIKEYDENAFKGYQIKLITTVLLLFSFKYLNVSDVYKFIYITSSCFIVPSDKYMIQIKEYDENAFKGYQIKLKDGRFPSNDKEIVLSEESLKKSSNTNWNTKCIVNSCYCTNYN